MAQHLYRYEVANLFSDETFDTLPLPGSTFDTRLGGNPGTFAPGQPLGVASRALGLRLQQVAAGGAALYAYRDGALWWGGVVWTATPAGDKGGNATWTCQASTWDSYLARVNWQTDTLVAAGDPLAQVRAILSAMQSDPDADIGLIADTTTSGLSSPATTYLASGNSSYGSAITALATQSPGFDYAAATTVGAGGVRTRRLRLGYPQLGTGRVHRLTRPGNILTYSIPYDATRGGTEARAFGATSNANQAGTSQPTVSATYLAADLLAAGYPRLDIGTSYSSVSDLPTLDSYAQADLAAGRTPVVVPAVTCRLDQTDITPDSLGDTALVQIEDPYFSQGISLTARIIGIAVTTGDRATDEEVTLTLN